MPNRKRKDHQVTRIETIVILQKEDEYESSNKRKIGEGCEKGRILCGLLVAVMLKEEVFQCTFK